MDIPVQVTLIGAIFTFFAGLVAAIVNFLRERSEKEKWQRTLELEREKWQRNLELEREKWQRTLEMDERRIKHEENKWVLELNSQRELELHKMRLRTYPEIFAALEQLSHYHQDGLNENVVTELATKLNKWGYAEAGLCMLPDTRESVFALRRHLEKYLRKEISAEEVMRGPRTDLLELMRRDLNHNWSIWRQFKTLTDESLDGVQRALSDKQ